MATPAIPPTLSPVPYAFKAVGGNLAFDDNYLYINYNGWRRFPFVQTSNLGFAFPNPSNEGDIYCDNEYFYIVVNYQWVRLPIDVIKPQRPIGGQVPIINIRNTRLSPFPNSTDTYGRWGMISFNAEYFCIWGQGKWHKIPMAIMPLYDGPAISLNHLVVDYVHSTQPANVYTYPGLNINFNVSASTTFPPLSYQWYSGSAAATYFTMSDGGQVTGSQTPILYINSASFQNSGSYFIEVWNQKGFNFTSSVVNLIILPPSILAAPQAQTNYKTDLDLFDDLPDQNFFTASFNVQAYGGQVPLTYQWYSGSTPLTDDDCITGSLVVNGNTASLQINCLKFSDDGTYYVSISNGVLTTSIPVPLTVLDNFIPTHPSDSIGQSSTLLFGNESTFNVPYVEGTVPVIGTSFVTGFITNTFVNAYGGNDTASAALGFEAGAIFNAIIPFYGTGSTNEAHSASVYSVGFDSGYIVNVLVVFTGSLNDTSSHSVGFESGSIVTVVTPVYLPETVDTYAIIATSLLTGSVT